MAHNRHSNNRRPSNVFQSKQLSRPNLRHLRQQLTQRGQRQLRLNYNGWLAVDSPSQTDANKRLIFDYIRPSDGDLGDRLLSLTYEQITLIKRFHPRLFWLFE